MDAETQDTGYVFDRDEAQIVVPLIDLAFGDPGGYLEAEGRLGSVLRVLRGETEPKGGPASGPVDEPKPQPEPGSEPDPKPQIGEPITHELERALMYELVVPFDGPVTCELGHHDIESEFVWPPRIQHVNDAVVDLWEFFAVNVQAPGAGARFHDLAFCRGRNRFAHAVAARDAYLEFASTQPVVDLDEAYALLRAWSIDRKFGRKGEEQECRHAIQQALESAWGAGERAAGVLLPMLGALCRTQLPADQDAVPVDKLLERASHLYGSTDSVNYVADLRRPRASNDQERRAIAEWQVGELAEIARKSEGLVKVVRLREAIDQARRLHLKEVEDALTVELQSTPPGDVKLEAFSSTVPVSRIPYERYFRQFTRDRDWRPGLSRFAHTPPPTGALEDLIKDVEERRLRPRVIDIITTVLLDEDRLPAWQPETDEERSDYMMAREAGFAAAVTGTHLAEVLSRIREQYGDIPANELAVFFALEGRGNYELAAVLARALHHFWAGDLEACIHIAVPRIESAIRLILRELDVAIYRTQLGQRPGVYPQLGTLLDSLAELDFDESWLYFLRWLLVNHSGKNLRNQVAHGRVRGASPSDAALVLRALVLLVLLCGPGNADEINADLEEPGAPDRPTFTGQPSDLTVRISEPARQTVPFPPMVLVLAERAVSKTLVITRHLLRRILG